MLHSDESGVQSLLLLVELRELDRSIHVKNEVVSSCFRYIVKNQISAFPSPPHEIFVTERSDSERIILCEMYVHTYQFMPQACFAKASNPPSRKVSFLKTCLSLNKNQRYMAKSIKNKNK